MEITASPARPEGKRCPRTSHFKVGTPDTVWLADISYVPIDDGWLYLAAVKDMTTMEIVGLSMSDRLKGSLAIDAICMALQDRRPAPGLICHSDHGVQYACGDYRKLLKAHGARASMSGKGNCLDNAPMESFFHTLKIERIHHRVYATRAEAHRALFAYIEGFYNSRRLHSGIGYRSPADMERMAA